MLLKYSSFSVANVRINLNNQLCKDQLHKNKYYTRNRSKISTYTACVWKL